MYTILRQIVGNIGEHGNYFVTIFTNMKRLLLLFLSILTLARSSGNNSVDINDPMNNSN